MDKQKRGCYESGPSAFQNATGSGVRIAVIDSGVNHYHPHIQGVAGGVAIGQDGELDSYIDFLGHGTAVLAAIKEKAPDAAYYAVKIYYRFLRTDINLLIEAIEWAIAQEMDLVNLSLGTTNDSHREVLSEAVRRTSKAGVLLVASAKMGAMPVLPGSLPDVMGVNVDWTCPRERFRCFDSGGALSWFASGYPRSLPGIVPTQNINGVSFAAANMTGFVARACQLTTDRSLSTVTQMLRNETTYLQDWDGQG
jgi:subtilisin family serine protease